MVKPRPAEKKSKTGPQLSQKSLLFLALIGSLGLNAYGFLSPKDNSRQLLASAGGLSLRRLDLSLEAQKKLSQWDDFAAMNLKKEAETWVENIILPKEAQSRGRTVQELLEQEVSQKVQVSQEEVSRRMAHSPSVDTAPYPQVLKMIEDDLRSSRMRSVKKNFLESLYPKYQVQIKIQPSSSAPVEMMAMPSRFPVYELAANGDPVKGPADAPVSIEIYSDFLCPFSARFSGIMAEVEKQYPGKIRIVFRQFPLPFHEGAHWMAEASLCAQEQGRFWEFHDRLMSQQKGKKEKGELAQIARELGLDASKFQACLDGGQVVARVDQDIAMGRSVGVSGTPGYLINGRIGSGAVPFENLKPLIDWCLSPQGQYPGAQKNAGPDGGCRAPGAQGPPGGNQPDPNKVYTLSPEWLKKSPSLGPENAPITIVEFLDYNCPFCQRGSVTLADLLARHPDQIRLISKEFPLPMHPNAMKAAIATSCAADLGKFWEYQKELFGPSWGKQSVEDLKAAAKKVGIDEKNFNACLDGEKTKSRVDEDIQMASALGVQGTPAYFINGTLVVGAQPLENFEKVIESKKGAAQK